MDSGEFPCGVLTVKNDGHWSIVLFDLEPSAFRQQSNTPTGMRFVLSGLLLWLPGVPSKTTVSDPDGGVGGVRPVVNVKDELYGGGTFPITTQK